MMRSAGNPDPIPEEDSEDLTDDEIAGAVPTRSVQTVIEVVSAFCEGCPECADSAVRMSVTEHALRRRRPNLFWRVTFKCGNGHDERVTFRVNWMLKEGGQ